MAAVDRPDIRAITAIGRVFGAPITRVSNPSITNDASTAIMPHSRDISFGSMAGIWTTRLARPEAQRDNTASGGRRNVQIHQLRQHIASPYRPNDASA